MIAKRYWSSQFKEEAKGRLEKGELSLKRSSTKTWFVRREIRPRAEKGTRIDTWFGGMWLG